MNIQFKQWQLSKERKEISESEVYFDTEHFQSLDEDDTPFDYVFKYENYLEIAHDKQDDNFYLVIENQDWQSDNLDMLERILYKYCRSQQYHCLDQARY